MTDKYQKYLKQLSKLPEEVQYYFESNLLADFIREINSKYNIETDYLSELIIDIIIDNFNFDDLKLRFKENFNFNTEKQDEIITDILGMVFLPLENYIKDIKVRNEIENYGGNLNKYKKYVDGLIDAIEDEKFRLLDELIKKHEELADPEEEEKAAFELFQNNIADILSSRSEEALSSLNGGLIYLFNYKKNFNKKLENELYKSEEKITHKEFKLNEKPQSPTIGNWLQDFIKKEGTGMFTNVDISKYAINSENAKKLDPEERELLVKLLILYRNLKFFPDSMEGVPVEDWAIIPTQKSEELLKAREVSGPPKTEEEKKIEELKEAEERLAGSELEKKVIDEAGIKAQRQIEDLKILAKKYKKGSLEAKAIEEEIGKLEGIS